MEEVKIEQKESIKLTKNAKGEYQWELKLHIEETSDEDTLKRLKKINEGLNKEYSKE